MAENKTTSAKVVFRNGLNTNQHFLELSEVSPGSAMTLLNYEPSMYGGYRRINGFAPLVSDYPDIDPSNTEGKILGVSIYDSNRIIVARKEQSGATYNFYDWSSGGNWTPFNTGLTLVSTGVDKLRYDTYNFDGTNKISYVDGVNGIITYDGSTWGIEDDTDQGLAAPSLIKSFMNHIFVSGDATYPNIVAHSAPLDEASWTSGSGAGQIPVGFAVRAIYPFRDELYVFGEKQVKKIVEESGTFLVKDVIKDIGTVSGDSVQEINSDLIFLAPDGFRTIAGTERIGDVSAASISNQIHQDTIDLISSSIASQIDSVVIRSKSQYRIFFNNPAVETNNTLGVLGGLKDNPQGLMFEWARLRGIRTSCVTSGYINNVEYVIHGDYNGKVYRQEVGSSFDGENILSVFTTPHLDFGDTEVRKTFRTVNLFMKPEGDLTLNMKITYDWELKDVHNPEQWELENYALNDPYGQAVYGISSYGSLPAAVVRQNVTGSGFAIQLQFTNYSTDPSYSLQGVVFEFSPNDRK